MSITIDNDIQNQYYTFSASTVTGLSDLNLPAPSITHTTGCALTYKLYAYFNVKNKWYDFSDASNPMSIWINTFSATTGLVTIKNFDGSGTAPTTEKVWKASTAIQMRIIATSTYSSSTMKTVIDDFILTLSDTCSANKIALDYLTTTYAGNSNGGI